MTATTTATGTPQRRRRWLRATIPFVVLLGLWIFTGVAHSLAEPDLSDPGTLSPTGTGPHGSSQLAQRLAAQGVRVDRVTTAMQTLQSAAEGDSTVFLPAPGYLDPRFAQRLTEVAGAHRIVIVRPSLRTLFFSGLPVYGAGGRWATGARQPGCTEPYARAAGRAAALHDRYGFFEDLGEGITNPVSCYGGGLASVHNGDTEIIVIGADDPFRNDRIGEHANATLATSLLGEHARVIWVDMHAREPVVGQPIDLPQASLPEYRRDDSPREKTGFPVIDAFPSSLWAALVLAFLVAVLIAVAAARRLGSPVAEPLPVLVPAAEAVTGRGRLYQRIRARESTLTTLRTAAMRRLVRALTPYGVIPTERDLGAPGPATDALIELLAQRTGRTESSVRATLLGPVPGDDDELAAAVAELDALVTAVLQDNPAHPRGGTP